MAGAALVTGGSGFIAGHLVPALVGDGWEVRTCGRRERPARLPEGVAYHRVDLAGPGADLTPLLAGVTRVFHLAGASSSRSSQEEMERSNAGGTENLVTAAAAAEVEVFVHMSSTSVYGEDVELATPVPESVEPRPSRGYGRAKWMAEQAVWRQVEKGFPGVVVRPVSVHGPGATKLLASAMLDVAIERFAELPTVVLHDRPVEQRLVHVDDLVRASLHLAGHPAARGRAFNVAMPTYPTSHDVGAMLADEFGMGVELDSDPDCGPSTDEREAVRRRMLAAGMTEDILFTPERFRFMRKANRNNRLDLRQLFGTGFELRQPDLRASITDLAAWYREHRWIL